MKTMKIITIEKYSLYLLSIVMALGTINPFNLAGSTREQAVQSFWIYPALFLVFLSYVLDGKINKIKYKSILSCTWFLIILFFIILISDIFYNIENCLKFSIDILYYIKLFINIISYFVIAKLFVRTKDINNNLFIYSIVMVLAILPFIFQISYFSKCFMFSNGRLWMYGENPNTFSLRLSIAVVYFVYSLFNSIYTKIGRFIIVVFILLMSYMILLSGSRGSLVVLFLSLLLLFWNNLSINQIFKYCIPFCIMIVAIIPTVIDFEQFVVFERFQQFASSGYSREEYMKQAIEIWRMWPIIGCGNGGYENEKLIQFNEDHDSHCIVTSILAMGGILGIFCFIGFIIREIISLYRIAKITYLPMIIFILIFIVSLKTGGIITYFFMYYIYALCMAYACLVDRKMFAS